MLGRGQRRRIGQDITEIERGDPAVLSRGTGVALVASWSARTDQTRSLSMLVRELWRHGYAVAVVSSCEAPGRLTWPVPIPDDVVVARRPNHGYDFGSWSTALGTWPEVVADDRVLLVNDSLIGPFGPIDHVLRAFDQSSADVWGLTSSQQERYHLQSFFLGFRGGVLGEEPLRRFWSGIRHQRTKRKVIRRGELGLARRLRREGYAMQAYLPAVTLAPPGANPAVDGWRTLLTFNVPMVKREILTRPEIVFDGDRVPRELLARFGVDVAAWL